MAKLKGHKSPVTSGSTRALVLGDTLKTAVLCLMRGGASLRLLRLLRLLCRSIDF